MGIWSALLSYGVPIVPIIFPTQLHTLSMNQFARLTHIIYRKTLFHKLSSYINYLGAKYCPRFARDDPPLARQTIRERPPHARAIPPAPDIYTQATTDQENELLTTVTTDKIQ